MIANYMEVKSFEDIAKEACREIEPKRHTENYILAFQISRENLNDNPMADVEEEARKWASEERPNDMYFSHGEYRVGGIKHISDELKRKPTSNRALYSLINQNDINGSGDNAIPSFMVFQCTLDQTSSLLNCVVYFRALEVSNFLRINLEEIRQNIISIYSDGVSYDQVKLLIIAGRAHNSPGHVPLKRPEIDVLTPIEIYRRLRDTPQDFRDLLREKAKTQSVVSYTSLESLKESLVAEGADNLKINEITEAIELSKQLRRFREQDSHSLRVSEVNSQLIVTLEKLADRFSE